MRRLPLLLVLGLALFASLVWLADRGLGPLIITRVDEQKLVLLFGRPVSVLTEPGLWVRVPLLSDVRTFDKRLLYFNAEPLPIQTRDEERIVVDNYVVWRITDPLQYFQSFPTGREPAEAQIDRVVRARVRQVVGQKTLAEVLTTARVPIMREITEATNQELGGAGIVVDDVRINRTELPAGTEENVYARMRAERQRLSRQLRAQGEEEGRRIRAEAEREALAAQVLALISEPRFSAVFTAGSRAEVPIVGRLEGRLVSGQIDRLVVTPAEILIVDYKTNHAPPATQEQAPQGYVRQLALYRAVLGKLYPQRPVRTALLWTETPDLMEISTSALDAALASLSSRREPA